MTCWIHALDKGKGGDMLSFLPITELAKHIKSRQVSPLELATELLTNIDRFNPVLNSYITVCTESVLAQARRAEFDISAGRYLGPLHGVPVSHKDISWTKDVRTTAHSSTLLEFIPDVSATHVERLEQQGMLLLGKTNTTEFAIGDMHLFGKSCNPWDVSRSSGASSGGSANAVAAGLAVAATGTDTGGSTRVPSSFCGVVGVKPTFGRVSRYGIFPLSFSMDSAGPITRTVVDAALMLQAMSGYDPCDPTTSAQAVPNFSATLHDGIRGLRLGIPETYFYDNLDPDVEQAMQVALRDLEGLGAQLEAVRLPMAADLSGAANVLVLSEAFSQHAQRLRIRASTYGPKARNRISTGAFFSSAEYLQAAQIRTLWMRELEQAMKQVDVLIIPTLPFTAFGVDTWENNPPDTSWGTRHFNMSGYPAMTVPCGFDHQGLPIGMQIVAKPFDEAMMFRVGHAYEQINAWYTRKPVLEGGSHA